MDDDHVEKVLAVIHQNRHLTVREVAEEVGICKICATGFWPTNCRRFVLPHNLCRVLLTDALLIREFMTKHETTVVPQPPYSPDLAPAEFFLFPKLKFSLKGRRFQKVEEIEENSMRDLRTVPQKHVPGRVPELEKTLGTVCQEWRGILWRRQVWLSFTLKNFLKSSASFWAALVIWKKSNKIIERLVEISVHGN